MQKVYLIRHGETEWNRQLRYQGQRDISLNEEGRRQAMLIADYLSQENIEAVFSSPLLRARETAAQIAAKHGLGIHLEECLLEIDFGEWEGRLYTDFEEEQRLIAERWFINPESVSIPGGELYPAFRERVLAGYQRILHGNNKSKVLVTHAGVIRVIVSAVLEMPANILARLRLSPASLTILLYDDWGNPYLELLNGASHLTGR
ncbi:MAG: histidine phosphatase family protein [Bacillota bacterium]